MLVSEEDRTRRARISAALERDGHEILTAPAGADVIAAFAEQRPDLVVLDEGGLLRVRETLARLERRVERIAQVGYWELDPATGSCAFTEQARRVLGLDPQVEASSWSAVLERVDPEDRVRVEVLLAASGAAGQDLRIRGLDGRLRYVHLRSDRRDGAERTIAGTVQDVGERKAGEERIRFLAYYDVLTRLPNRQFFLERLDLALLAARRSGKQVAVVFLDLDRFKRINDALGHAAGDALLVEVGQRLRRSIRRTDPLARAECGGPEADVARLGGDEFIAALPEMARGEDAARVARRVLAALRPPFLLEGHEVQVTASVGISLFPSDGDDAATLLRNADMAMYRAKDSGEGSYRFYDPALGQRALQRLSIEAALRRALERDELFLEYQPRVEVESGRLEGLEALPRWRHPELGVVPPTDFLPIAEESGLIAAIEEAALRTVCAQAAEWTAAGLPAIRFVLRLSPRHLDRPGSDEALFRAAAAAGVDPRRLEIGIPDGALDGRPEATLDRVRALRDAGISISLDDYGAGPSALGRLRCLPADRLKIDRSLVRHVDVDGADAAIVAAIVVAARGLGLGVVADGVERAAQLEALGALGCRSMQGYLFGMPRSFAAAIAEARDRSSGAVTPAAPR